ncbi:S8 family serine peptidase [Planctomycetota bacterium]
MQKRLSVEHLERRRLLCGSVLHHGSCEILGASDRSASMLLASSAAEYDLGEVDGERNVRGFVGGRDQVDLFGFEISENSDVEISLDGRFGQRLTLLDSQLNIIESESVFLRNQASLGDNLSAGTYFVSVRSNSWYSNRYQLQLDVQATIPDGAGNKLADAYQLGSVSETSLRGHVGGTDTADVFQFSIDRDSSVDIKLDGLASDVDLYVVAPNGTIQASSRNAFAASESIQQTFGSGTYYAIVRPYEGAVSNYQFQIETTPIARIPTTPPAPPIRTAPPTVTPTPPPSSNQNGGADLTPVPYYGGVNEWNLNSVDAPESWAAGYTGENVIVAVVDTGIDLQHTDLDGNIWTNTLEIAGDGIDNDRNGFVDDVYGWNFAASNNNPDDGNGHGTHVAGTIAAEFNSTGATGVAYGATVMPVKVLGNNGEGSDFSVASGIRYAVDNGADIINLSLGSHSNSRRIRSALEYAATNDVFIVAASGNESSATPGYPAIHSRDLNNVISVGAHDRNGNSATFSNGVGNSRANQVDAPGVRIYSTLPNNRYGLLSGTSMASPHVAGVAALTLSANPNLTAPELKRLLIQQVGTAARGSDARGAVDASLVVARAQQSANVSASNTNRQTTTHAHFASIDAFFANSSLS